MKLLHDYYIKIVRIEDFCLTPIIVIITPENLNVNWLYNRYVGMYTSTFGNPPSDFQLEWILEKATIDFKSISKLVKD